MKILGSLASSSIVSSMASGRTFHLSSGLELERGRSIMLPAKMARDPLRDSSTLPFPLLRISVFLLVLFFISITLLLCCFQFILVFLFSWSQLVGRGTPECGSSDFAVVMSQSIFSSMLSVTAPSGLAPEAFLR